MVSLEETFHFLCQVREAQLVIGDTYTITCNVKSPCIGRQHEWWAEKWAHIIEQTDKALAERGVRVTKTVHIRSLMLMEVRIQYAKAVASGALALAFRNGCCARPDCPGTVYERELLVTIRRLIKEEEEAALWPRDL
jgi:hypothetical protein